MDQVRNEEELKAALQKAGKKPVFVCFIDKRCPYCKKQMPHMEDLASKFKTVFFFKVDIRESPDFLVIFKVKFVPDVRIFFNGNELDQVAGADREEVEKKILQFTN